MNTRTIIHNIIPGRVTLSDTIRSMTEETRTQLHTELRRACQIVEGMGGRFDLELYPGYPPTVCAPEAVAVMKSQFIQFTALISAWMRMRCRWGLRHSLRRP